MLYKTSFGNNCLYKPSQLERKLPIFLCCMRSRTMAAISMDPRFGLQMGKGHNQHGGVVIEEIDRLIRVYKDGHIERQPIVPEVPCTLPSELDVLCKDITIDKFTNVWTRIYMPAKSHGKLPLLVYFHGGGFCLGSASWICYHNFLGKLASNAGAVIMSVNYRLAPEHRLPAAYEDGSKTIMWVKQQAVNGSNEQMWWLSHCNFSKMYLCGDSAGANIAYNVGTRVGGSQSNPLCIKGTILIQPFFGGEARTNSERCMVQPPNSALSLLASDVYWRLSLPNGANRDHPWCNPISKVEEMMKVAAPTMVCVSETDILKDRNLEFCNEMRKIGKKVEHVLYRGVGHAFQVLDASQTSQIRTQEMMSHIKDFIRR